jgi:hypothetical protein
MLTTEKKIELILTAIQEAMPCHEFFDSGFSATAHEFIPPAYTQEGEEDITVRDIEKVVYALKLACM